MPNYFKHNLFTNLNVVFIKTEFSMKHNINCYKIFKKKIFYFIKVIDF